MSRYFEAMQMACMRFTLNRKRGVVVASNSFDFFMSSLVFYFLDVRIYLTIDGGGMCNEYEQTKKEKNCSDIF